jgi:transposase
LTCHNPRGGLVRWSLCADNMTLHSKPKSLSKPPRVEKTLAQIASEYKVHPNQIRQWRRQLLETLPDLFSDRRKHEEKNRDELEDELYRQIGQLKVELEWLKKNLNCSNRDKEGVCGTGQSDDSDLPAV